MLTVKLLEKNGAELSIPNNNGSTPLHVAIENGQFNNKLSGNLSS